MYQGGGVITMSRIAVRLGEIRWDLTTGFSEVKILMTLVRAVSAPWWVSERTGCLLPICLNEWRQAMNQQWVCVIRKINKWIREGKMMDVAQVSVWVLYWEYYQRWWLSAVSGNPVSFYFPQWVITSNISPNLFLKVLLLPEFWGDTKEHPWSLCLPCSHMEPKWPGSWHTLPTSPR